MEELNNSNFEQRRLEAFLKLDVDAEKLSGLEDSLAPSGIGSFTLRQVLSPDQIEVMQAEIFDPHRVRWRDNHHDFVNARGMLIEQNHDVFALRLLRGDMTHVERVPHMRALATNIQGLIRGLSPVFPTLVGWQADEMSLHRYDEPDVGLSFHRDNLRFTGLIAVVRVEGTSDFLIRGSDGVVHTTTVHEGDLVLTRATELYPAYENDGSLVNLCPDHSVVNVTTPAQTSFIVRDNSRPEETLPGFTYENWP